MTYALVNSENIVVNIILWDGVSQWTPPPELIAVQSNTLQIGDTYTPE